MLTLGVFFRVSEIVKVGQLGVGPIVCAIW